jgi:predicted ATP-grasp superfamily ATP-dependent carboligase
MYKFLLTGSRAPVTLELARNLAQFNHQVYAADCWRFPVAHRTNAVAKSYRIASPRLDFAHFKQDLIKIIKNHDIDFLVPTCEEVFYISHLKKELSQHCQVICPDFELIEKLHSKKDILDLANGCAIELPKTIPLEHADIKAITHQLDQYIIKSEFGRFGVSVWCDITPALLQEHLQNPSGLLLQQKIPGEEFCTYSIAHEGELLAHVCYHPTYRIPDSASMYFAPVYHPKIQNFVSEFVKKYRISGQIAFDIKEHEGNIFLIECNPRANSGLHLLIQNDLGSALTGKMKAAHIPTTPAMLSYAMCLSGFPRAVLSGKVKTWFKDYKAAREVICSKKDKSLLGYQFLALCEWFYKSIKLRINLRAISTYDIEWNGGDIE